MVHLNNNTKKIIINLSASNRAEDVLQFLGRWRRGCAAIPYCCQIELRIEASICKKQEKMGITNCVEEGMVEEKATGTNFPHLDLRAATAWSSVGGWRRQEKKGMDRGERCGGKTRLEEKDERGGAGSARRRRPAATREVACSSRAEGEGGCQRPASCSSRGKR